MEGRFRTLLDLTSLSLVSERRWHAVNVNDHIHLSYEARSQPTSRKAREQLSDYDKVNRVYDFTV